MMRPRYSLLCQLSWVAAIVVAASLGAFALPLAAQSATVTTSVFIIPDGYDVEATSNLTWGSLLPNEPNGIDPIDPEAGCWEAGDFIGFRGDVVLDINAPASLTNQDNAGADPLVVNWREDDARVRTLDPAATGQPQTWDPAQTLTINVGQQGPGGGAPRGEYGNRIEVCLGGLITGESAANAAAGNYTGTVRLFVTNAN